MLLSVLSGAAITRQAANVNELEMSDNVQADSAPRRLTTVRVLWRNPNFLLRPSTRLTHESRVFDREGEERHRRRDDDSGGILWHKMDQAFFAIDGGTLTYSFMLSELEDGVQRPLGKESRRITWRASLKCSQHWGHHARYRSQEEIVQRRRSRASVLRFGDHQHVLYGS